MNEDKKYEFKCPYCSKKLCCTKSARMIAEQKNTGFGQCTKCQKYFAVLYEKNNDSMSVSGDIAILRGKL